MTSRRALLAALVALSVLAAGCSRSDGGGEGADATTTTAPSSGPTTTGPLGTPRSPIPDGIRIEVLSSQADRISGDDARIRVHPPRGVAVDTLRLDLDGADVTGQLAEADGALEGVLRGLVEGTNTLTATAGGERAVQRLRAWPRSGPIISGPHLPLRVCTTEAAGLGTATDDDCSAPTKVEHRYLDRAGALHPIPPDGSTPTDLATATIDGRTVPLYIRIEKGVINRAVYEIASVDTTPGDDDPTGPGWNRKVLYRFGGGCGTSYSQGSSMTATTEPTFLREGYAVATATFNTFQVQCNDVLSAETTMMVKERIIEAFGVPDFTIGEGASGGAIQLHLLAQNYPGLVNGIVASLPFPDALSIAPGVTDCGLLLEYYGSDAGRLLTPAQRTAINGHATDATCAAWKATFLGAVDPTDGCDPAIDDAEIYDPVTNRGGLRCTLQDANRNQMGTDPDTGFARRPLDNVGVQYGFEAFNDGVISFEQFADLNRNVGGYDIDGKITASRTEADFETVLHAYETGRISMGGGDQLSIPIIDINVFTDEGGDIHDRFRAFSLRERLTRGAGADAAPGFQIWTLNPAAAADAGLSPVSGGRLGAEAVAAVDAWLEALRADTSGLPQIEVLRRTRPEAAVDRCVTGVGADPVVGTDVYERRGPCRDEHPLAGDPRIAAGGPLAGDVLKCALGPVDPSDYEVALTPSQLETLREIFPTGVCDWDLPGDGALVPANPDRSFEDVTTPQQSA